MAKLNKIKNKIAPLQNYEILAESIHELLIKGNYKKNKYFVGALKPNNENIYFTVHHTNYNQKYIKSKLKNILVELFNDENNILVRYIELKIGDTIWTEQENPSTGTMIDINAYKNEAIHCDPYSVKFPDGCRLSFLKSEQRQCDGRFVNTYYNHQIIQN